MSQSLDALSPAKRALLERMLQQRGAVDFPRASGIPRAVRDQPLRLSSAQQRIWLWQQINPDSAAYHVRSIHRIHGPLNKDLLARSLSEIVRGHDILRTTYHFDSDDPMQRVADPAPVPLPLSDLSGMSEAERSAEIVDCLRREIRKPFDLERGLPCRFRLLKMAEDEHIFTVVLHHVACDGWSLNLLLRELGQIYEALTRGRPSPLPELPLQFADFAQWQRSELDGDALGQQRKYWINQLADAPAFAGFPTDLQRPAMQTYQGAREEMDLPPTLVDALNEISRCEGTTLFMTVLAAFQVLLFRYTGRNDVIVGSPVAGRDRVETENLIGCFINTLVLRTRVDGNLSFRSLLKRVRDVTVDAFTHQGFPFERLLEELQPERNFSYSPVFQVLFALENLPRPTLSLQEMSTERIETESGTTQFDISVKLRSGDDGSLRMTFDYNTDLFRPSTVSQMMENHRLLLTGAASNPDSRIAELPILSASP